MASSGSLFGGSGSTPAPTAGGGLFGSSTSTPGTGGGGLFGSSNTAQSSTNTPGGLFGSTSTTANPSTSTGTTGLFGSTNTTSTSSGIFGSSTPNTSSGLFGTSTTTGQNAPASGGLFGSTNTAGSTGGGLFGSSTATNKNTSGGGLFGSATAPTSTGGGLFGSSTTSSGGGLFGGTTTSGGLFGSSTSNTGFQGATSFGIQQPGGVSSAQAASLSLAPWWFRELDSIAAAYEPFGQRNKFQTILYEVIGVAPDLLCVSGAVAPTHIEYVKKQRKNEIFQRLPWLDQREWQLAEQKNPDPSNLMPTPIIGIDALHERVGQQMSHVRTQLQMLTNAETGVASSQGIAQEQSGKPGQPGQSGTSQELVLKSTSSGAAADDTVDKTKQNMSWLGLDASDMFDEKIEYCRHEHVRLMHRLIKVMGRLERLQCLGTPRTKEEIAFDDRLNKLRKQLDDPQGCKAMISELGAQLQLEEVPSGDSAHKRGDGLGLQAKEEEALFKFLEFQRDGLEHLMKIVKKDMRDLHIIQARLAPHVNK